jgi:hypothetical protein
MLKISGAILLLGAVVVTSRMPTQGSPQTCDPQIWPQAGNLGYRLRGDRCEGLYETAVAAIGAMRPVSLTDGDISLKPGDQDLWWTASPSNAQTIITVTAFSALYRMDARVRGTQYRWPTDVVIGTRIPLNHIGIVAVTQERLKNRTRDVYLPVSFRPRDVRPGGKYILKIGSPEDLEDLSYEISRLTSDGDFDHVVTPKKPVPFIYYTATPAPIMLDVAAMPAGLYQVDVDGKRIVANAGRSAMSFLLRR